MYDSVEITICDLFVCFFSKSADKEPACSAGDPGSIPGLRRSPGEGIRLPTLVFMGFPGVSDGKESACNVGNLGSVPGLFVYYRIVI